MVNLPFSNKFCQKKLKNIKMDVYKRLILTVLVLVSCCGLVNSQSEENKSVVDDGMYQLTCGDARMKIDGTRGARIVSFEMDGIELMGTKIIHPAMYGSTLWLSPEGKWRGQGLLDNGLYQTKKSTGSYLRLKSLDDTVRGFAFEKEFKTNKKEKSFSIKYTITNIAEKRQEVAAWEVTRVPAGGLAFISKGNSENNPTRNARYPLLNVQDYLETIWYPYDTSTVSAQKCFMDGGEGWVAYTYKGLIFVKKFPVIEKGKAAPNENNIEIYVNREKTYIELENQGAYRKLDPGESLIYEVKWYARQLPSGLSTETGNEALIDYVRRIVLKTKGQSKRQ
jgi:hypothetical protein